MRKFILLTSLMLLGHLSAAVPDTAPTPSWNPALQSGPPPGFYKPENDQYVPPSPWNSPKIHIQDVGWVDNPDYYNIPKYGNDNDGGQFAPLRNYYSQPRENITGQIPVIETKIEGFTKVPDVMQYGGADWSGVVGIIHNTTLQQAAEIARENPEITYFFYMTTGQLILNSGEDGTQYRVFRKGDAVFFSGEPWWGSAQGHSNGYIKE